MSNILHKDRSPRVSIIIPYYNHGKFIDETLESIDRIGDKNLYEVIIVNDGSPDPFSDKRLKEIATLGYYLVVQQENQGVSVARNNAVAHARGEYILPVDSDNKIKPEYVYEAIAVLDNNSDIDIVYSDYDLFGAETGVRKAGEYNFQRLLLDNFIENCALVRKSVFDKIGGYDPFFRKIGIEDWDLWLNAAFAGCKFHYIPKPLFDYRVAESSRIDLTIANKRNGAIAVDYFIKKYKDGYGLQYVDEYFLNKFRRNFLGFLGKIILRIYFPKMYDRMVNKGKFRKYL